jgi:hypothetical protein
MPQSGGLNAAEDQDFGTTKIARRSPLSATVRHEIRAQLAVSKNPGWEPEWFFGVEFMDWLCER